MSLTQERIAPGAPLANSATHPVLRCGASVQVDRRGRSTACGCMYHAFEVRQETAPCGHAAELGIPTPSSICRHYARTGDIARWQQILRSGMVRLPAEKLGWFAHLPEAPRAFEPTTPAGAAYCALWHCVGEEMTLEFVQALAAAMLARRDAGAPWE